MCKQVLDCTYCYTDGFTTEDDIVLRITVPIEFVNSGMDEADLTLKLLNPVGRSWRDSVGGSSHWNKKSLNKCGLSRDKGQNARMRSLSTLDTYGHKNFHESSTNYIDQAEWPGAVRIFRCGGEG